MRPVVLPPNLPPTFYRGAGRIADFRGDRSGAVPRDRPEDWIASTVSRFGQPGSGVTVLDGGTALRDEVDSAPAAWLGRQVNDGQPSLNVPLVKYLDAGERLPVHVHPDDTFARSRLGAYQGKTEAWLILDAPDGAGVHLGWRREMPVDAVADLVRRQDTPAMLDAMNPVPVSAGDVVVVPAGTVHAIGAGIFLAEVQQAADLSILLEWQPFLPDAGGAFGGVELDVAIRCVDPSALAPERVDELVKRGVVVSGGSTSAAPVNLLPAAADGFFQAVQLSGGNTLPAGYSTLVILYGSGSLAGADGEMPVERGMTLAVPHAAGDLEITGDVAVAAFRPPGSRDLSP